LKYPPFPWAQHFQDGAHQTTGTQRKIFEKCTIFFGHPVHLTGYDVCDAVRATLALDISMSIRKLSILLMRGLPPKVWLQKLALVATPSIKSN
jgi:hypothetical protein